MRTRPKYTEGMNEIRKLLDNIGSSGKINFQKDQILWNILTALRGPDNENNQLKEYSTARLRNMICPTLSREAGATVNAYGNVHNINDKAVDTQKHFNRHFNWAVNALSKLGKL